MGFWQPCRRFGSKAARAILDGVTPVGGKGLADFQGDAWQRFGRKAFYRITIKACDLCWAQGHRALLGDSCALVSRIHRTRATAHEFVKTPLPFPDTRSHICLKLGREAVDGCQCG